MGDFDDGLPQTELDDTTLGAYVHSPYAAVQEVFEHLQIGPGATVFDLGCGDGRVCLIAADMGAIGYGVDIDAGLIDKFNTKAATKSVSDRAIGIVGDACNADRLPEMQGIIPTHIYLFILQHRLHLIVPCLQRYFEINPEVVIVSAFDLPFPTEADERVVPTRVHNFQKAIKIYRGRPRTPAPMPETD